MQLAAYPLVDIAPAVAEVLSNPEPGRSFACVSPCVQGGDGHCQVLSELLGGEKTIDGIHGRIVRADPVIAVLPECHTAGHEGCSVAAESSQRAGSIGVLDRAADRLLTLGRPKSWRDQTHDHPCAFDIAAMPSAYRWFRDVGVRHGDHALVGVVRGAEAPRTNR
jgi:hypothetical protein